MSHIIFQAPTVLDAENLALLARRTFVDTFGHLYNSENLHNYLRHAYDVEKIRQELQNSDVAYQVAIANNQLIGYCKVSAMTLPIQHDASACMELRQLYILKPYWGSDAAPHLMQWVFEQAKMRAVNSIYLGVYSDNLRAQRFYARYGFQRVGEYHFMVGTHADLEFILRLVCE